ncbi:MAG TPA: hypothetical protein DEO85_14780 [Maritimibacter sp.]|nr:hypothetical protein [Maritimibacter sp.]
MSVTRAWLILMALSALATAVSVLGGGALWTVLAILLAAWIKARIVLRAYLDLATAPEWSRGFSLVLGLFMIAIMGLAALA